MSLFAAGQLQDTSATSLVKLFFLMHESSLTGHFQQNDFTNNKTCHFYDQHFTLVAFTMSTPVFIKAVDINRSEIRISWYCFSLRYDGAQKTKDKTSQMKRNKLSS